MNVQPATRGQLSAVAECLVNSFAADPQLTYFFPGEPEARSRLGAKFFLILLEARMELGMPVLLSMEGDNVLGAVMGYDTRRLPWPASHAEQLSLLEASQDGLSERFAQLDDVLSKHEPNEAHYYLGVVGVKQSAQGHGVGKALMGAFLRLSDEDPLSRGVFLETANRENLSYYRRFGFDTVGNGTLTGTTSLWCLYRRKPWLSV